MICDPHFRRNPSGAGIFRAFARLKGRSGIALVTVMTFAIIVIAFGSALFSLVSYEGRQVNHRKDAVAAFYLADAGVEHARAMLQENGLWRGSLRDVALGDGTYDVDVEEGVWNGTVNAVRLTSQGTVDESQRVVEAWVTTPPVSLALLVMKDFYAGDTFCLNGHLHVNGDIEFDPTPDDVLRCLGNYTEAYEGTFSSGYTIVPPPMWTEPDYFVNSTYYRVTAKVPTHHQKFSDPQMSSIPVNTVKIWRYIGTGWYPEPIVFEDHTFEGLDFVKWDNRVGKKRFRWEFDNDAEDGRIEAFFDTQNGVFKLETVLGHESVVVDFGNPRMRLGEEDYPVESMIHSHVLFKRFEFGSGSLGVGPLIESTIINTRFNGVGSIPGERLRAENWVGGLTEIRARLRMAPRNGIAMIVKRLDQENSQIRIGTTTSVGDVGDAPAMLYVTGDVDRADNSIYMWGTMLVLGNWGSDGEPIMVYDDGYLDRLPFWLKELMNGGGSTANTVLLEWKERPSNE